MGGNFYLCDMGEGVKRKIWIHRKKKKVGGAGKVEIRIMNLSFIYLSMNERMWRSWLFDILVLFIITITISADSSESKRLFNSECYLKRQNDLFRGDGLRILRVAKNRRNLIYLVLLISNISFICESILVNYF